MDPSTRVLMALLLTTHALSLAVWIGVMLFNLIVGFPAQRSAAASVAELTRTMGSQARRAAPWLYLLIALVALSGLGLQALVPQTPMARSPDMLALKWAVLGLMATLHGWGSWRQWPRIYFALDKERPALLRQYQWAMAASAALGITAIVVSYGARGG